MKLFGIPDWIIYDDVLKVQFFFRRLALANVIDEIVWSQHFCIIKVLTRIHICIFGIPMVWNLFLRWPLADAFIDPFCFLSSILEPHLHIPRCQFELLGQCGSVYSVHEILVALVFLLQYHQLLVAELDSYALRSCIFCNKNK